MKKALFTTALLALMLCLLLPAKVMAQTKVDGLWYTFDEGAKTAAVVSSQGTSYQGDIAIPQTVKYGGVTYSVTSIGVEAFRGCSGLTSITIPEGVTSIGDYAFSGCRGLTSVTIPEGVTSIGSSAFQNCYGLTSITIPEGVTSIGSQAFASCSGLTSIVVESGNSVYDSRDNCNAIIETSSNRLIAGCKNTVIPSSVTSIGDNAFGGCSGLTSITIPEGVTSIGWLAFYGCSGLTSITVESGNSVYDSRDNCNAIIETSSNRLIAGCKNTVIPESVTGIGDDAFEGCSGLTSITIPESVTSIGYYAFSGCSGLTSITIPESVTSIGSSAFSYCSGLTSITIPESVTRIGNCAFQYCSGLTSITIPESVTSIGGSAFSGTPFYNNQPDGLVYVGDWAYEYKGTMPANTSISLKEGTVGIADDAFYGCSGLTSITIPASVTSIGGYAFSNCSGLTSITIPEGVTSIGIYALRNCSGLTSITISEGVTSIGNGAFQSCSGLSSITIPESVTSIGNGAFQNCSGLTSIVVESGNSVYDSRDNCNAIINTSTNELIVGCKNTVIPASVTSIGWLAFYGCSGLTSITIPEGVTSIESSAFSGCSGLTSITVPEGVTSIGNYAFEGCTGLTSIAIPASVTSIGYSAFDGCSSLTSVTVKNPTPVAISDSRTFENRANATLYVPAGSKAAYEAASYWKDFKEIVEIGTDEPDVPAYPEIEDFAVVLNGERQTLHGKLVAQDGEEYIVTDAGVYRVTGRRERLAGDVNGDGKITIADVTGLVNVILGHAEAESATIYNVEHVEGVTGIPGNGDFIGWGGTDEDGSLDPNVKKQRF